MKIHRTLLLLAGAALAALLALAAAPDGGAFTDSKTARALVKAGALLLDVRTPEEFQGRHLDGAVNIPLQELEGRLATLEDKKQQDIVVYCHSGRRSASAKALLEAKGFTRVHNLGGLSNW